MQQYRLSGTNTARCTTPSSTRAIAGCSKGASTQQSTHVDTAIGHHQPTRRKVLEATIAAASVLLPLKASAANPAGDWTSPGLAAPEDEALPKFFKAPSGAKVQELIVGKGPQVQPGDAVLVDYVLRRSNGYFIYGTIEGVSFQPKDVPVGPVKLQLGSGEVIEGLETALVGMRQGGKRRILVPPEVGYVSNVLQPQMPTFGTKRQLANHSAEPLLFEVELLRVIAS